MLTHTHDAHHEALPLVSYTLAVAPSLGVAVVLLVNQLHREPTDEEKGDES